MSSVRRRTLTRLYKYRPLNRHTIRAIMYGELYFASPHEFNDPFDSAFSVRLPHAFYSDPARYVDSVLLNEYEGRSPQEVRRHRWIIQSFLRRDDVDGLATYVKHLFQEATSEAIVTPGVFCSTTVNDSLLMWSHYADKHRGVCLEYDAQKGIFPKSRRVMYSDVYYCLAKPTLTSGQRFVAPFLRKSRQWEYESEFRLFRWEGPGVILHEESALVGVYLGCRCEDQDLNLVASIVNDRSNIALYRGLMAQGQYHLTFAKVEPVDRQQGGGHVR